jgi:hypothetical protein
MAAPVSPCDSCGSPIPDSDLESGAAIILLSKRYCSGCKSEAMQSVSMEELGSRPAAPSPQPKRPTPPVKSPPPAPARARGPEPSPAPRPAARPERKATPARRPAAAAAAPAASRKPLVIAVAAVALLGAAAAFFLLRGSSAPADPGPTTGTGTGATGPATASPEDRAAQARAAFAKVQDLSQRIGVSWDLLLAAADKARPVCSGTEWEKKLEEIRTRALQEKAAEEASRDIAPLLDELKGAVATDPEFKRFPELQSKFQIALEAASKSGSVKKDEIRALQREYNGKYEKLAEPHFTEINEAAQQLADERRFDDAIRKIEAFPQHLRHSGAWMSLEKLKKEIERRRQKK